MTGPDEQGPRNGAGTPEPPTLASALEHLRRAEAAAARADFDSALRERFRAVLRGMEQRGLLPVRRSRTAHETADESRQLVDLSMAAQGFDEVVYGGRAATAEEYRRLTQADRFSAGRAATDRPARTLPSLTTPSFLRNRWLWLALVALAAVVLVAYLSLSAHKQPPTSHIPPPHVGGNPLSGSDGRDSIFQHLPHWLLFGGLQWLVCAAIVMWWRGRRRVALVDEPLPVRAPANEVLTGRATLYHRAHDREHAAAVLRAATLRRIRPVLALAPLPGHAELSQQQLVTVLAARLGQDGAHLAAVLFDPVPDDPTLVFVANALHHIESEIR